ncbi:MAG: hypothetical protein ABI761_08505 [Saprospiraceae bacterium]
MMKSILFIFVVALGVQGLQAQSCHAMASGGSCCAKSASTAMTAAENAGIQIRKDVATGDLSFHRKTSCAYSDHATFVEVKYDSNTNSFVNKAPDFSSEAMIIPVSLHTASMKKMDCSTMSKAECAGKMAKGECQPKAKT